jgi:hypothetical protein
MECAPAREVLDSVCATEITPVFELELPHSRELDFNCARYLGCGYDEYLNNIT